MHCSSIEPRRLDVSFEMSPDDWAVAETPRGNRNDRKLPEGGDWPDLRDGGASDSEGSPGGGRGDKAAAPDGSLARAQILGVDV